MKTAIASGGRLVTVSLYALCLFLCIPLFDCKMRTLIVVPPLLGKKHWFDRMFVPPNVKNVENKQWCNCVSA